MKAVNEVPSTAGDPIRPPGLLPLPNERLWKPHEDKYWNSLRKQWAADADESPGSSQNGHSSEDDHEEMDDVDLTTANGTLFRIVLPSRIAHAEQGALECDTGGVAHTRTRSLGHEHQRAGAALGSRGINHSTPIADAISIHLPPPAVTKKSKKGNFKGSALNVSVTTSTRTYGDFSKSCPPPYTPRPTNAERSFGRNGKLVDEDKMNNRWAVSKWLFILGFLFPLLWLFGSFLLFTGLRKLQEDTQVESQISTSSKFDTPPSDTTSHTNAVAYMISQEILWSKRCAWAIVLFGVACFITLGVLKAVGM